MKMLPWKETLKRAQSLLEQSTPGVELYQEWRCVHCGVIQHMDMPNMFYTLGRCEQCDHTTDLQAEGCGFAIVVTRSGPPRRSKTSN
jgi:hypothetical protein